MDKNRVILQAIALRSCIQATYNRMAVKLAPHILYTRHDELFVDAVTVERDGQPPREQKLGTFKLAGLAVSGIVECDFALSADFDPAADKYDGVTLFAVDA
ncbi:hypothetical protein [Flavisphingomonas formosensis]|uniref:hypothetical protein n=1 Tax=Flavisphingomonas formosensis TaxID=861534 RepID=UPI0012FB88E8|nr:hypothetical protein [Sphingomonas formosensis]